MSRNEKFEQLAETVADVALASSVGWKKSQGGMSPCGTTRFLSTGLNHSNLSLHARVCVCISVCCSVLLIHLNGNQSWLRFRVMRYMGLELGLLKIVDLCIFTDDPSTLTV